MFVASRMCKRLVGQDTPPRLPSRFGPGLSAASLTTADGSPCGADETATPTSVDETSPMGVPLEGGGVVTALRCRDNFVRGFTDEAARTLTMSSEPGAISAAGRANGERWAGCWTPNPPPAESEGKHRSRGSSSEGSRFVSLDDDWVALGAVLRWNVDGKTGPHDTACHRKVAESTAFYRKEREAPPPTRRLLRRSASVGQAAAASGKWCVLRRRSKAGGFVCLR